jgi:aryl-alcohol dehydrogenase-like predicted oxidoreductase
VSFAGQIGKILEGEGDGAWLAQKSLRWVLDHDAVSTVIPGAKNAEQAKANAEASEMAPLSEEAHAKLRALYFGEIDGKVRGRY